MKYKCSTCDSIYYEAKEAEECCFSAINQKIDLTQGYEQKQFINSIIKLEAEDGDKAITKVEFEGLITPEEYGQFLWETHKRYGALTEEELYQKINIYNANVILTSLHDKGLIKQEGVDVDGNCCYSRSSLGKTVAEALTKEEKVYRQFFQEDNNMYGDIND